MSKIPNSISDIPTEAHFAIIRTKTIYVPPDERSQTNPGHGYPGGTESYVTYQPFTDQKEWEATISELTLRQEPFVAITATPATVAVNVDIKVGG